jgi:hypothetical protein
MVSRRNRSVFAESDHPPPHRHHLLCATQQMPQEKAIEKSGNYLAKLMKMDSSGVHSPPQMRELL